MCLCYPLHSATVNIEQTGGQPNTVVSALLSVESVDSVALVTVQVNYDAQMLDFVSASRDTLGAYYEMLVDDDGDGRLFLTFVRSEAFTISTGRLAQLHFRVNTGAPHGMATPLVLAKVEIGNSKGVPVVAPANISARHGKISSSPFALADTNNNSIPDEWEIAKGLGSQENAMSDDPDGDGISNFLEYAFGGHPKQHNAGRKPLASTRTIDNQQYLSLDFKRLKNTVNLRYVVETSSDLVNWEEATLVVGTPADNGDGSETVSVRDNVSLNTPGARRFMRVRVVKE